MEKDLDKKVSVVTGGGSGIGQATALLYALHGAKVVVADLNEQAANNVAGEIKQIGGEAISIRADVSKPEDCEQLINKTIEVFPGFHPLGSNSVFNHQSSRWLGWKIKWQGPAHRCVCVDGGSRH